MEKDLGFPMGVKLDTNQQGALAEGRLHPGLCQKQWEQQNKGGDSAPQLCPRETPPAGLCPGLESSPQERAGTEEGHEMIGGWSTSPTKMG